MDWIEIKPSVFREYGERNESDGVEITVGLSPFDIPEGVRGQLDNDRNRFVIELKYLDTAERRIPNKLNEYITVFAGENSHRLYEIEVDVNKLDAKAIKLALVEDAIRSAASTLSHKANRLYGIANRVLDSKQSELDEQLLQAQ